ncbi:MAG: hypothetical protein AAF573_20655 [Bacteroidota bacterium]
MNNLIFDSRRFLLLLQKELWTGNKKTLITIGAVFGFLILYAGLIIYNEDGYHVLNYNLFPIVLLGGGLVFTSVCYHEFNDKTGTHHYLSLPASTFEKFLSKWFITAILFPLAAAVLFWLYTKIGDWLYFQHDTYIVEGYTGWSMTNWWTLFFVRLYVVIQTIYLVGAIAFQKYTFFKTSLSLFLAILLFAGLCLLAFRLVFADFFVGLYDFNHELTVAPNDATKSFMINQYQGGLEYAFWLLLPAVMLVVGFFKLKEKEA